MRPLLQLHLGKRSGCRQAGSGGAAPETSGKNFLILRQSLACILSACRGGL
jgi:hypothetical protein